MPIDRGMFNDDQLAVMDYLDAHPELVCPCGWYTKDECARYCPKPRSRDQRTADEAEREAILYEQHCADQAGL